MGVTDKTMNGGSQVVPPKGPYSISIDETRFQVAEKLDMFTVNSMISFVEIPKKLFRKKNEALLRS